MNKIMALPVLYSLRNCPYAMRARLAIYASGQQVQLRDLVLSNKPAEMLEVSPKGTVPVLVTSNGQVIEESLEVMLWAFEQSDPDDFLDKANQNVLDEMLGIIAIFDNEFKGHLEHYRAAKRYHEPTLPEHREACESYLVQLEQRLCQQEYLMSDKPTIVDLALVPFIRQFARVERQWYLQSPYPKLRQWLNTYLQSRMFSKVMTKYPMWLDSKEVVVFGEH
ncbi:MULTISPECIES: glutathione S-transferase [unclassified Shewanella]|uniref:glutathione S-transferase n=1 Tax=unclassified Shewanella TaxID=196818 RepID=UPI001E5CE074|nr:MULTISPECIES: glutathione S-transferase [unclassified Shewanella]